MTKSLKNPDARRRRASGFPTARQSIIALEKRIAFDGAGAVTAAKIARDGAGIGHHDRHFEETDGAGRGAVTQRDTTATRERGTLWSDSAGGTSTRSGLFSDTRTASAGQPTSVVFIESDVPDIATLIKGIDHSAQIVLLDASKDGVDAIADYLSTHKGVENVYIFSHGSDAHLSLGTADLDADTMQGLYAQDLATIKNSLGSNANILVYGCDFAENADGDSAARLLSSLTGASVAASTNLTGGTAEGGDFVLEDQIGTVSAPNILAADLSETYDGVLATQKTGAFTMTTGTSGAVTSGTTVATATTADGAIKIVVTVTPNSNNSAGSITTTSNSTFDTSAPSSAYTTSLNGAASLEETLEFGGTTGGTDGANSATITIAYYDAKTGAAINVTNPIIDIDRLGGSATNSSRTTVSDSSDLAVTTAGATLTKLAGSSGAFNVSSSDIYETVNTALASGFSADANSDPTKGTAAGTVQVNGTYSTLTFNWSKAAGSLNGGDKIDLIFSADDAVAQSGALANKSYSDGQSGISVATSQAFSNPSGLPVTFSATGLPAGLTINPTTGVISGTVDHDASKNAPTTSGSGASLDGTYTVVVTATNDANNAATQTFQIDSTNQAPVVGTKTANQTNNDGDTITAVNAANAFSDPNGDPLTYTASGLPAGLSISSSGMITGTIAKNATPGTDSVTVTATDDKGAATQETFSWVVRDVAPTANGTLANRSYADGQSGISIATSQGFSDSVGNTLTYSASGLPAGLSINATTGAITGTLDHDASKNAPVTSGSGATLAGTYTIVVTASDGLGGTTTQSFTIASTNQAPVVGTKTANQTSNDGQTITSVNASSSFSDPNGDPLTYSVPNLPAGLTIDPNSGIISGTVAKTAAPGVYSVRVLATDDKGAASRETFNWTVNDVPPTANGTLANQTYADATANISIATAGGFTSPNGLALTYTASGLPLGLSIDPTTGVITGQLDHDASKNAPSTTGSGATLDGKYTVTITGSDGQGGTATQTFTIDATNNAPTLVAQTPDQHGADGQTVSLDGAKAFNDVNTGDAITYAASGLPQGLSINANTGLISGTIAPSASNSGPYTVTVTATDDKGAATSETFHWTVDNVAPVATPPLPDRSAYDGNSVTIATASGFTNPNNLTYTYSATGLPAGLTIDPNTGVISGTLDHDASVEISGGKYTIAVTANDGQGGSATNTFHLTSTNQAPVLGTATANQTANDGQTITPVNAAAAFSDPNGDPLTYTATNLPSGLSIDATSGTISGIVAANAAPGVYKTTVTATDDKGLATPETFTFTIADVPPQTNGTLANQTYADSTPSISIATSGGFTSPNGLTLTYSATGLPTGLSIDPTSGAITGTLDHDASKNAPVTSGSGATLDGTYTVTVTASDGQGGTAVQSFTIDAKNSAPSVVNTTPDQQSTEGNTASVNAATAFSDPNAGDTLTYAASGLPSGLSINSSSGLISGTLANDASTNSPYSVTVTATDDKGAATTETFAWTVQSATPGVASPIPDTSAYDGAAVSIDTASHFDNPGMETIIYSATGLPPGLSIDPTTGAITGTLNHDASKDAPTTTGTGANLDGTYTITVTATDLSGSTPQTFKLDVTDQAPVINAATPNQTNATGDTIATVDTSTAFSDPNGDPLTYTASGLPTGLSIDSSGKITGTIAKTAPGLYSVVVTATDDKGAATAETFKWTVTDVAPTASGTLAGESYADSQANISIATSGGFSNPQGLPLTYSASGLPAGLSIDPTTGVISGQLDHDASKNAPVTSGSGATLDGTYAVVVTVSDGQGGIATQSFHLDATNNAPTLAAQTADQHGADGQTVSLDASQAFADSNVGDTLTYAAAGTLPPGLSIDPTTGLITGTIAKTASAGGPYAVSVTATDDKGAATTETFNWVVVDVAPTATPPLGERSAYDGSAVTYATAGGFTNPNGLPLTYSATGLPSGLSIDPTTGMISGTLDHEASAAVASGKYTIAVTVDDGQGGTATNTFLFVASNQAPVVGTRTPNQSNQDGATIQPVDAGSVFTDPNGDTITYSASNLPSGLSIDPTTGLIKGTVAPNATPGNYYVTVTATDDKGAPTPETFTWSIGDVAPTTNGTLTNQRYPDSTTGVSIATADGFTSPNGLLLTFSASGLPHGLTIDPSTGIISGYIGHDDSKNAPMTSGAGATLDGTYTVVVSASDGQGGVATQTFTVDTTNQAPTLGMPTSDPMSKDGDTVSVDTSRSFADPNIGDVLTYTATGLPAGLSINAASGVVTGTIDPHASTSGPYSVTVTATDDKGAATSETFSWTVADNPPVASGAIAAQSFADSASNVAIATSGAFYNPNGLPLTYSAAGLPAGLTIDPTTGVISGTLDHDASKNAPVTSGSGATLDGTYTVTITADDSQGGISTQSFTIDATNNAPVVGTATANQHSRNGDAVQLDTSSAFSDPNTGDILNFTVTGLPQGLAIDPATGRISGTIDARASAAGPFSVTVTATDDKGAPASETFSWVVDDVPPQAGTSIAPVSASDGNVIPPIDTASHFSDSNGVPLTYTATGLPAGLSIDPATGLITGTIDHDASKNAPMTTGAGATLDGRYTITITASDGLGGSASQTFTIDSANAAPIVRAPTPGQYGSDGAGVSLDVSQAFYDPNNDVLTYAASGLPLGLSIDPATGRIAGTIDPRASLYGPYAVVVTATDDKGASVRETFVFNVDGTPVLPLALQNPNGAVTPLTPSAPDTRTVDVFATAERASDVRNATPVLDAVNSTSGDDEQSVIVGAEGIVVSTVNNVKPLNGLQSLTTADGGIVRAGAATNERGDRYLRANADFGIGIGIDEIVPPADSIGTTSLDLSVTAIGEATAINIQTLVHDRVLVVSLDNASSNTCVIPVVAYDVTLADGSPLPGWLRVQKKDVIAGKVPGGVDSIDLRITSTLANGDKGERVVTVRTDNGAIKPRPWAPARRPNASWMRPR